MIFVNQQFLWAGHKQVPNSFSILEIPFPKDTDFFGRDNF